MRVKPVRIAQDWKVSAYYDWAEQEDPLETFWGCNVKLREIFNTLNTIRDVLVELACGQVRHMARILNYRSLCDKIEWGCCG